MEYPHGWFGKEKKRGAHLLIHLCSYCYRAPIYLGLTHTFIIIFIHFILYIRRGETNWLRSDSIILIWQNVFRRTELLSVSRVDSEICSLVIQRRQLSQSQFSVSWSQGSLGVSCNSCERGIAERWRGGIMSIIIKHGETIIPADAQFQSQHLTMFVN